MKEDYKVNPLSIKVDQRKQDTRRDAWDRDYMGSHYVKSEPISNKRIDNAKPVPMVVGTPSTPLGNDIDYSKETYYVADGVCGFAWVNIKPARGKFVTWMKKNNIGRKDSYYGGWTVWVSDFGQSMARKEDYARAFAGVLNEYGISANSMSRMD